LFITPDVAINSFVADREPARSAQVSGDLLRAPLLTDEIIDFGKVRRGEALITARTRPSPVGAFLGLTGSVVAVKAEAISCEFAADGGEVAVQGGSDLRLI
jgi:hypothetical protein